jgi:hypothetical protein
MNYYKNGLLSKTIIGQLLKSCYDTYGVSLKVNG